MQCYDYIIIGTGASGLMLAHHLATDSFFDSKKILLLDKVEKNQNDRTWCFWEKKEIPSDSSKHSFTTIKEPWIYKKWDSIYLNDGNSSSELSIAPYSYKMIRSEAFYIQILNVIKGKSNFTIKKETVLGLKEDDDIVEVDTNSAIHLGKKVFNSVLFEPQYKEQKKYPVLNQHFIGWFIKTKTSSFDKDVATFMDFSIDQKNSTRFMYVLPISESEALLEYTLFSEHILSKQEYEEGIKKYLKEKGILEYEIVEKEMGCIPMTCYEFRKQNTRNILNIGTAGGWTKPSTGYTFYNSNKKIVSLIPYLKKDKNLAKFEKRTRFWWYDILFLDVLYAQNQNGAILFSKLFQKNKIQTILRFLDEETTFLQELKIMWSMPTITFTKVLLKRLFNT